MLLHLDIHLHRMELTCLRQAEQLQHTDAITLTGKGLRYWHRQWVEAIAAEFVHTTRFDPLHRAESEQDLYNRLTAIAADLKNRASARIELPAGETTYRSTISGEQLISRNADALNDIYRAIRRMLEKRPSAPDTLPTLLVSHRIACLPGVRRSLSDNLNMKVKTLPEGAAALGAHALWDDAGEHQLNPETVFRKSKPWGLRATKNAPADPVQIPEPPPSHILSGAVAYPLAQSPLIVMRHPASGLIEILMQSDPFSGSGRHCMILRRGEFFYLEAVGMPGATVNERPVSGDIPLKPGDRIRLGDDDDDTLKIIACL
jgi:hypothetical protein